MPVKSMTSELPRHTKAMDKLLTAKTPTAMTSTLNLATRIENREDPAMADTMKVEKINPNGRVVSFSDKACRAGVHIKTKMYMEPSKSDEVKPHNKISRERMVTV